MTSEKPEWIVVTVVNCVCAGGKQESANLTQPNSALRNPAQQNKPNPTQPNPTQPNTQFVITGFLEASAPAAAGGTGEDGDVRRVRGGGRGLPLHGLRSLVPGRRVRPGGAAEAPGRPQE